MAIARMIIAETMYRSFDYSLNLCLVRLSYEHVLNYLISTRTDTQKHREKNGNIQTVMQQNFKR